MSPKQLISSDEVRAVAKRGEHVIYLLDKSAIVTAEAASTAKSLGITLEMKTSLESTGPKTQEYENGEAAIRRVLAAHTGGEIRQDLLTEVMRRVALERLSHESEKGTAEVHVSGTVRKLANIHVDVADKDATRMSTFDLTSLINHSSVPSAVGFMNWSNSNIKFKRTHDEVLVLLEGDLVFQMGSESLRAVSGDVILISKNSPVEIRTQSSVRVFYASYNGSPHGID